MTFARPTKDQALDRIRDLVDRYQAESAYFRKPDSDYGEADTRSQFLDPLLEALGWDVRNAGGQPSTRMEVLLERTDVEGSTALGRPDYRLRLDGTDVMPVEAKKPSVPIGNHAPSAIQARRYGWSLSLPAAVLSNFDELVIFDTIVEPRDGDGAHVAALPTGHFKCTDYVERFDDLWRLLSYESIRTAGLEQVYEYTAPPRGESPFDASFLSTFRDWRSTLAQDVATQNPQLPDREVGRRVQKILNALLFLRICEDRNIRNYEDLLRSANSSQVISAFRSADNQFNAGLFTVLGNTDVGDAALASIVREMYWPESQFAFGVLEPQILAGVYEQYLAEQVTVDDDRVVAIEQKPEITHSGGVVSTPDYIVKRIGDATLDVQLRDEIPTHYAILDLAVGSGIFLLDAYSRLIAAAEQAHGHLDIAARGKLATDHLFGIDIDGAAVEVARLSMLLAILGNDQQPASTYSHALPDLSQNIVSGNSIVREDFDDINPGAAADISLRTRANPLDIHRAFGSKYPKDGFSAIIGNPPYIRIQELSRFFPEVLAYLQSEDSGYDSPQAHNFDAYMVFVERALDLVSKDGRLGFIIPQRFTNLLAASPIRDRLRKRIEKLVHFGEQQVFPGRTTYSAIAIAGKRTTSPVTLELVEDLEAWRQHDQAQHFDVDRKKFTAGQWPISTPDQNALFDQLRSSGIAELGDDNWVHIFVGVQTSADDYYFINPDFGDSTSDLATFTDCTGVETTIEKSILRPAILDQKIDYYGGQPAPDRYAIFPYLSTGVTPKQRLLSPEEMAEKYPHALAYFERHRERLAKRAVSPNPGDAFWAYGRSQSVTALDRPKLVVRVLSLTPKYAIDTQGLVVPGGGDGGPYYLLRPHSECPYSLEVIQALLSHPIVDLFVAVNGKKYRGAYASHRKAFLEKVPVPRLSRTVLDEIEEAVQELRELSSSLAVESDVERYKSIQERQRYRSQRVENLLSAAYGLDQDLVDRVTGRGT